MPMSQRPCPSPRPGASPVLRPQDGGAMSAGSRHAADPAAGGAMTGPCPGAAAAAGSPDRIEDLEQLRQEVLAAERAVTVAAVNHGALLKRYQEAREAKLRAGDTDAASIAFTEDTDDGPPQLLDSPVSTVHSVDPDLGALSPRPPALPGAALRAGGALSAPADARSSAARPAAKPGPSRASAAGAQGSAAGAQGSAAGAQGSAERQAKPAPKRAAWLAGVTTVAEAERRVMQRIADFRYF
eukprot:TRINITY_DN8157_c0_g1_i1.p1 TRINITY_DN8157_c0_g1~~TRINITY_DN8157_c0_g1_i1.p1  ORF type:complete len:267 (+),score=37.82 TRINITY_DN8157_c0_g1_i1:81-803(+)